MSDVPFALLHSLFWINAALTRQQCQTFFRARLKSKEPNMLTVTYQTSLVWLSLFVGIIGSLTALTLTAGLHDADGDAWESSFTLANGGLIMGTTIWSLHFIAMMAVDLPVLINYNIVE